jgi:hypothetical protein
MSSSTSSNNQQGYGEEKKMGGCKRNFFKPLRVLRNFLDVKEIFTKFLKVGGGVQNLIFPSDNLFFK